ncbi:MAG TPA: D-aminoacylase [Acidimicrobiales bacterium]|jgi:N-acyl-D-aspartate/D-glutamate deacylase
MLDYAIKGGTVVDGTGAPPRRADVGIRDGRIVAVGQLDEPAAKEIDATGLLVCPGFVDPHTHYDAQLYWDPFATPSSWHGVTSVIGGNCGFTLAPIKAPDADYTRRMMAKVEGMPLAALEAGVPWTWETFGEYLDGLDGRIAVNAGFMVGHCALRRYVMGEEAVGREAKPEEIDQMVAVLHDSLAAGGLGLSTTRSSTHNDGDSQPVASRWATEEELVTLCGVVGEHEGTSLEAIVQGCLDGFSPAEIELFARMSATARRPLNWNVLSVDPDDPGKPDRQLRASRRAREIGGRVVALTMPVNVPMNMSFNTFCALWLIPGWNDVLNVPVPERKQRILDPEVRERMLENAMTSRVLGRLAQFGNYVIGDAFAPELKDVIGRKVSDLAQERGKGNFATLAEIVAADDMRTILWPTPPDTDEIWKQRSELWQQEDVMLGGSDAGAHLDRMCGSPYPTKFLGDSLRGRQLVPVEEAVRLMTDVPARLFGLRDRGRITEGFHADITIVDPATVDAELPLLTPDLPGDSPRLLAKPVGVHRVFVNGVETIVDGEPTGATAGTVLRSGQETDTVLTA